MGRGPLRHRDVLTLLLGAGLALGAPGRAAAEPPPSAPSAAPAAPRAPLRDVLTFTPVAAIPAFPDERQPALVLPAVLDEEGARRRPTAAETDLTELLARLDELLLETARDLGLAPIPAGAPSPASASGSTPAGATSPATTPATASPPPDPATATDAELLEAARRAKGVVIVATVRVLGPDVELRLSLAGASRRALASRAERFARDDLAVRAAVMLRDVVTDAGVDPRGAPILLGAPRGNVPAPASAPRSEGRAILAANATIFGGLMGFSVERASGSDDPRLLYPLLAVGAGVGLGASLLIADEWDVGTGDAWFLSSGAVWPSAAAHLIFEGRFGGASGHPGPEGDRWAFGLVGGTLGLGLSTLSLALGDMESGGAILAHSGGAFGLALGGLTEWFARGSTREIPFAGMGYGAALGWLAAASAATTRVRLSPSRVLTVDLGAILGGLGGAALASPLLFDSPDADETRGWVAAMGGGALVGTAVALWLTRGASSRAAVSREVRVARGLTLLPDLPEIGFLSAPSGVQGEPAPAFGARLRGRW